MRHMNSGISCCTKTAIQAGAKQKTGQSVCVSVPGACADVLARVTDVYSLDQLIRMKRRWKVSLAALNYRLHKIGITSDWRNRDLCIQIAREGFHKNEPASIEREKSIVWEKLLKLL